VAKLASYRSKRDFDKTKEPRGKPRGRKRGKKRGKKRGSRYVIQKHDATRLHYDLRLELDGVMLSWAVTRGPSLVSGDKRLAIHVEDHPIEYNKFEGTIPKGEYGGGTVMIWDRGIWQPEHDARQGMKKGHLDFSLDGDKLKGRWHLVRMRKRPGERQEPWLLIKSDDEFARRKSDPDILDEEPNSATTGRDMEEIAGGRKRVWHSHRRTTTAAATRAKTSRAILKDSLKPSAKTIKPAAKASKRPARRAATARAATARAEVRRSVRLPDFVPPCLATLSERAPDARDWLHEIKFDGYRVQAHVDGGKVKLLTRNGLDWTDKFPSIAKACAALAPHRAILDGEVVSGDENGVTDFSALQDDLKRGRQDRMVYYVFDLLHLDGADLTGEPLTVRRRELQRLAGALPKATPIRFSEDFGASGPELLNSACEMKLEGIVSKRRSAPYRSGRNGDWLKTKCSSNQELVIAGYEPSDKQGRAIRSLLLGYYDGGQLRYAGRVGTGWNAATDRELKRRLDAVAVDKPPFGAMPAPERRRKVKWAAPKLIAEINFRGWTNDKLLRQPSFKGLREDKKAAQVVREVAREVRRAPEETALKAKPRQAALRQKQAKKAKAATPTAVAGVKLSHPDRVYWPDAGVTKAMLADYYAKVWDEMRPHVTGRVLALLRCPEGITSQCFFQKHASAGLDDAHLRAVKEPDGETSIAIDSLDGLIALVQAGVLEIHVRGSSVDHLEQADRLVFDLDPGPGVTWKDVIAAAREVRKRLDAVRLKSFVKTTGGKGIHVVVPIRPTAWDDAKEFCHHIAEAMARDAPQRYTATLKKSARSNRIFIDYLRNSREATAVAPYSSRARAGAAVSTPMTWEELGRQKTANAFTIENLPARLAKLKRDPWNGLARLRQALPRGR
jgi:bifunctional non-homologous end joining protein LigD